MNGQTKLPPWVGWLLLLSIGYLAVFSCCGIQIPGIDILFFLAFGWIWFLVRVIPQIHVRWDLVASTASPEQLYRDRHRDAYRAKCSSNLKNIAAAFITYSNTHGGRYPDDMRELIVSTGMTPQVLVCPASNDSAIEANTPEAISAGLAAGGHCSYLYFAKGLTADASSDTVLVTERLENHGGKGMNVLYGDYHVIWMTPPEAEKLLATLKANLGLQAQTQPTTKP